MKYAIILCYPRRIDYGTKKTANFSREHEHFQLASLTFIQSCCLKTIRFASTIYHHSRSVITADIR